MNHNQDGGLLKMISRTDPVISNNFEEINKSLATARIERKSYQVIFNGYQIYLNHLKCCHKSTEFCWIFTTFVQSN